MINVITKPIFDPCVGSGMFYFDKNNPLVHKNDVRKGFEINLCDGRGFKIIAETGWDYTNLPIADNSAYLIPFDPSHLIDAASTGWQAIKYGILDKDWRTQLRKGFAECFRVLKPNGVLIFKWNEVDIPVREILALTPYKPVFGHKSGKASKTHWICFFKYGNEVIK